MADPNISRILFRASPERILAEARYGATHRITLPDGIAGGLSFSAAIAAEWSCGPLPSYRRVLGED